MPGYHDLTRAQQRALLELDRLGGEMDGWKYTVSLKAICYVGIVEDITEPMGWRQRFKLTDSGREAVERLKKGITRVPKPGFNLTLPEGN